MTVVQIAPAIRPGSGVEAVAYHLEQELERAGVHTERFTMADAHGEWLPAPGAGPRGRVAHVLRVAWFSTVGSVLARRRLAGRPDVVSICHNDALAGDVYVNHGILQVAMRARGRYVRRMLRNPLHPFTVLRDHVRYRGGAHRVVVNLTERDDRDLRRTYPRLRPTTVVIGNGVDPERFRPPTAAERAVARSGLGLAEGDAVMLFVGHEFERKGLPAALTALRDLPDDVHLVVVGGTPEDVAELRTTARARGVGARVHPVGVHRDPRPFFHAADVFVFPSAYEAYPLVVLEALASGVPVVATPVGSVPEVLHDGVDGFIVDGSPHQIADGVRRILAGDRVTMASAARRTAEQHSWAAASAAYLDLVERIGAARNAGGVR
ncbi:glycosyltransferase family 4 protein [Georgenia muralis]